ncbi:hypothetical protein EGW08_002936 [Elysia chlorotica]|uniref:Uncharacterized protein n=1 Tax=Elysia chlorotica TaxID=188477 RepID=A0A433U653_ELYCH|nr:hypothetical protein EGW08_002936 [Elysia chlorotica]
MAELLGLAFSPSGECTDQGRGQGSGSHPSHAEDTPATGPSGSHDTRASTSLVAHAASKGKGGGKSSSKSSKRRPLRETKTPALPSRDKGKKSCGQMTVSKPPDSSTDDIAAIKAQLQQLMRIVPVVEEIKLAYDSYNEQASTADCHPESEDGEVEEETDTSTPQPASDLDYFMSVSGSVFPEGPSVDDKIAKGTTAILCTGLPTDTKDRLHNKYTVPGNCPRLAAIPCNAEIFKSVGKQLRSNDSALQNIQKHLLKGLSAVTYLFDQINHMSNSAVQYKNVSTLSTTAADSIALLANASHEIDIFRRQSFRTELKPEYASLCSNSYPVQDMLFSSELPEKIKDLGETFKVSQRVNKRFHPYKNEYNKKPFPFLGQRHSSWKKGRGARWGNPNYRQDRYLGQAPRQNPVKKNQPKRN